MEGTDVSDDLSDSRGAKAAEALEACIMHAVRQMLDSVSIEEVREMLEPLPTLRAEKVKAKYDDLVLEDLSQQIHTMVSEPRFIQCLSTLKDLELKASSSTSAWRPSKQESTSDLYRPYRVKFLKEQIDTFEQLIRTEQIKLDVFKAKSNDFIDASKKIRQDTSANNKQLDEIISDFESEHQLLDAKLQEFRIDQMKK